MMCRNEDSIKNTFSRKKMNCLDYLYSVFLFLYLHNKQKKIWFKIEREEYVHECKNLENIYITYFDNQGLFNLALEQLCYDNT